jgi:Spx/MgsR family transcriptional regulator
MLFVYGIASCTTVRHARAWLAAQGLDYQFHDVKTRPVSAQILQQWCEQVGWQVICNKASLTWRNLPESIRQAVVNSDSAVALMQQYPNLIKRPLLVNAEGHVLCVGFKEAEWLSSV